MPQTDRCNIMPMGRRNATFLGGIPASHLSVKASFSTRGVAAHPSALSWRCKPGSLILFNNPWGSFGEATSAWASAAVTALGGYLACFPASPPPCQTQDPLQPASPSQTAGVTFSIQIKNLELKVCRAASVKFAPQT